MNRTLERMNRQPGPSCGDSGALKSGPANEAKPARRNGEGAQQINRMKVTGEWQQLLPNNPSRRFLSIGVDFPNYSQQPLPYQHKNARVAMSFDGPSESYIVLQLSMNADSGVVNAGYRRDFSPMIAPTNAIWVKALDAYPLDFDGIFVEAVEG